MVKLFRERSNCCRLVQFARLSGIAPEKPFRCKVSDNNEVKFPNADGATLVNLFPSKSRRNRLESLPMVRGTGPWRSLSLRSSSERPARLQIPEGSSPAT